MTPAVRYFAPLLLVVALCLSSCGGGSGPCGAAGQRCCGWPGTSCSGGSISCQSGTCRSCGSEGGPCCGLNHDCNPNLFCNSPPGGPDFVCQACGHVGQPACVNNLCVTGVFSGGRCVAPGSAEAMCNGSMSFILGIRDGQSHCRRAEFSVRANSLDDARMCAVRAAQTAGWERPEAVDNPHWEPYRFTATSSLNGCDEIQIPAYSEEDGEFCARFTYQDRTIARADACP